MAHHRCCTRVREIVSSHRGAWSSLGHHCVQPHPGAPRSGPGGAMHLAAVTWTLAFTASSHCDSLPPWQPCWSQPAESWATATSLGRTVLRCSSLRAWLKLQLMLQCYAFTFGNKHEGIVLQVSLQCCHLSSQWRWPWKVRRMQLMT